MTSSLMTPVRLGEIELANRVVMAPLTRSRASSAGIPNPVAPTYYAQRASAGLIVSEGVCISPEAVGNPQVPGLWSAEQGAAWRPVTEAVHAAGGRIVAQLWHTGRASHPSLQPGGALPLGPSPIAIEGWTFARDGRAPYVVPRELATEEIVKIVEQYAAAAERAMEAGFDGVELHAANGYLVDQFLQDRSNRRTDPYGGAVPNRVRFLAEVVTALTERVGPGRVGVRISPTSRFQDMGDSDPEELFDRVVGTLAEFGLAYLHVVEPGIAGSLSDAERRGADLVDSEWIRKRYPGRLIAAGEYRADTAVEGIESGRVDAVAFGRLFISNPDLPRRLVEGLELAEPQRDTFYGGGSAGYIDYPAVS